MAFLRLDDCNPSQGHSIALKWQASSDLSEVFRTQELRIDFDVPVTVDDSMANFMFLILIAPCYAKKHSDKPIRFETFAQLSETMFSNLRSYHHMDNLHFKGSFDEQQRSKAVSEHDHPPPRPYAMLFGGGKDSLLSSAIYEEAYGADKVTLLRLVWDLDEKRLPEKRKAIGPSEEFLRSRGFDFEYVQSNFHQIAWDIDVGHIPDLGLYFSTMLPLIALRRFCHIAEGYEGTDFHETDGRRLRFPTCRPEGLKLVSKALVPVLGHAIQFSSLNYGLQPGTTFRLLAKGYPEYLPSLYMCERLRGKWCKRCRKCFLYALCCLAFQVKPEFALPYFFQESNYIHKLIADLQEAVSLNARIPYVNHFAYPTHICSTVQILKSIDLDYAKKTLASSRRPHAYSNLLKIIEPFQGFNFPDHERFWERAYDEFEYIIFQNDPRRHVKRVIFKRLTKAGIRVSRKTTFNGFYSKDEVLFRYPKSKLVAWNLWELSSTISRMKNRLMGQAKEQS